MFAPYARVDFCAPPMAKRLYSVDALVSPYPFRMNRPSAVIWRRTACRASENKTTLCHEAHRGRREHPPLRIAQRPRGTSRRIGRSRFDATSVRMHGQTGAAAKRLAAVGHRSVQLPLHVLHAEGSLHEGLSVP